MMLHTIPTAVPGEVREYIYALNEPGHAISLIIPAALVPA